MPSVTLGRDTETGQEVKIGDIERRSGLYILGKPGMGKSALLVNIAKQDIEHGHGVFFLDPHGDAISDLLKRIDSSILPLLFNPADREYSFGINLLSCNDITDLTEVTDTYTRVYNVFYKLWEDQWGPWLQLILQNTLWAFIENPDYTLAEVPLFLNPRNSAFRNHILSNVKLNPACVDFWQYEFFERRERDQQERVDAALTRVTTLLTHPYVRHIIGQRETTLSFTDMVSYPFLSLLVMKLSANLPEDIKKFIGTIIFSELLHAIRNRKEGERRQFCIFVDEFQNFASSDDIRDLITQGRKYGSAFTFAHQERYGQFADNQRLMGATLAAVNKVIFQSTVIDAKELAPEFAKEPTTTETHLEPELVITPEPFWDLLKRGHANPQIQEFVNKYLWPIQKHLESRRSELEAERLKKTGFADEATLYRDEASLSQADEREEGYQASLVRGRSLSVNRSAIDRTRDAIERTRDAHLQVRGQNEWLLFLHQQLKNHIEMIDVANEFLRALMRESIALEQGNERFAQFLHYTLIEIAKCNKGKFVHQGKILDFYIYFQYGDWDKPRSIPAYLAYKYYPAQTEEAYMQERRILCEKIYRQSKDTQEKFATIEEMMQDELSYYRQSKVFIDYLGKAAIKEKGDNDSIPRHLPDLSTRIFSEKHREELIKICKEELLLSIGEGLTIKTLFQIIEDIVAFCCLLQKPENHIKVASGQYVEKQVYVRPVHDMTDEMAQELGKLPRFSAYAKVIEEKAGVQTVWTGKIYTNPLPPETEDAEDAALGFGYSFCQKRSEIETEIRERQEKWRAVAPQTPNTSKPPPTSEPPPTSD